MKKSIAGVVVLYHPTMDMLENITSYLEQIDTLFIINNSINTNPEFISALLENQKNCYIDNYGNEGIAKALNIAIKLALEKKYDYLLMMDQDSSLDKDTVVELYKSLQQFPLAALANATDHHYSMKTSSNSIVPILTAITSGSLLRLSHTQKIGLHEEKLFIDYVDFEYTLRTNLLGYKVLKVPSAKMIHKLGNFQQISFFGFHTYITHHSPIRKYYRLRNSLYVWKKYFLHFPKWVIVDILRSCKDILKCFIFEDDRFLQLKAYIYALRDFSRAKYGRIDSI